MGIEDWNVVTRKKYRYNTKEDDLAKISISVYITNFPDSCSAKDLFQTCKAYGHVVDSYIPFKRSKSGKRFGFVRFQRPPANAKASAPLGGNTQPSIKEAWSRETFIKIGKKWGETLDLEDNSAMSFGRKRICIKIKHATSILESFKIHKENDCNSDGGSAIEL
nr:nucleotide-binding alpha-beta plait domain-containing protein [Tanacetum cinerariifolium]